MPRFLGGSRDAGDPETFTYRTFHLKVQGG
jgi:hypothetical protein